MSTVAADATELHDQYPRETNIWRGCYLIPAQTSACNAVSYDARPPGMCHPWPGSGPDRGPTRAIKALVKTLVKG